MSCCRWMVPFLVLACGVVFGQGDPTLVLRVQDTSTLEGGSFTSVVSFDNTGTSLVDGWSYGVCIGDPSVANATGITNSALTATINGGMPPGFPSLAFVANQGWTHGIVIDFFGVNKLPPGVGYPLANLQGIGLAEGISALNVCDTIGNPPVDDVIVIAGGSIEPVHDHGMVEVLGAPPPFEFVSVSNGPLVINYDPVTGIAGQSTITVQFGVRQDASYTGDPDTQGFSMANACDGEFFSISGPSSIMAIGVLAALNGGTGPGFITPSAAPSGTPSGCGWTLGVVYNLMGGVFIQFPTASPASIISVEYVVDASSLIGVDSMDTTVCFPWSNTLGNPPVENGLVVGGGFVEPLFVDGCVTFHPSVDVAFVRGDCNDDGRTNIADGIFFIINMLSGAGSPANIHCEEACDSNGDGRRDIADPIYIFNWQLHPAASCATGCPAPPAPFPGCGSVAGAPCNSFASCP